MLLWKIVSAELKLLVILWDFVGVSSLQVKIQTLQQETPRTPEAERRRRAKISETEQRILEVEAKLRRQLSLSEMENLAKMAETELINARLSAKVSETESALAAAIAGREAAETERARIESKMGESELILKQMATRCHDAEERIQDMKTELRTGGSYDSGELDELKSKLAAAEAKEKQDLEKLTASEKKLKAAEDDMEKLRGVETDMTKLKSQLLDSEKLKSTVADLQAKLAEADTKLNEANAKLSEYESRLAQLEASLRESRAKQAEAESEKTLMEAKISFMIQV